MRNKLQSLALATVLVTALIGTAAYVHAAADSQKSRDHAGMMQGGDSDMMGMMNMMQQMNQMMESCNGMMQQHRRDAGTPENQKKPTQKP